MKIGTIYFALFPVGTVISSVLEVKARAIEGSNTGNSGGGSSGGVVSYEVDWPRCTEPRCEIPLYSDVMVTIDGLLPSYSVS